MVDTVSIAKRSQIMAAIRSRDTKPEMKVRKLVHGLGYRFRLHQRNLPGCPDIVFSRLHMIINIHGCFWHAHSCQSHRKPPKQNAAYWSAKIARNVARDSRNLKELRRQGWKVLTVWECQTRDVEQLTARLARFLSA